MSFYNDTDSYCKTCRADYVRKQNRTKDGLIKKLYYNHRASSKKRGQAPPAYNYEQLRDWVYEQGDTYEQLYDAWVRSDYDSMLKPSIDRLDDYGTYNLNNLQLMTWAENKEKYSKNRVKQFKAVKLVKNDGTAKEFACLRDAAKFLDVSQCYVSHVSNGTLDTEYIQGWRIIPA